MTMLTDTQAAAIETKVAQDRADGVPLPVTAEAAFEIGKTLGLLMLHDGPLNWGKDPKERDAMLAHATCGVARRIQEMAGKAIAGQFWRGFAYGKTV